MWSMLHVRYIQLLVIVNATYSENTNLNNNNTVCIVQSIKIISNQYYAIGNRDVKSS